MATHAAGTRAFRRPRNVGPVERAASIIGGLALVARGAVGYCPAKAALTGRERRGVSLGDRLRRSARGATSGAAAIDSLDAMYVAELQELCSADAQLEKLLPRLARAAHSRDLAERIDGYAAELREQGQRVAAILQSCRADPRAHPDDAMAALIGETGKMMAIGGGPSLRDAALAASLQRIIHYRIATLGTIATYAKTLGYEDAAASLAAFSDNEKAIDAALTELAKSTANPRAALEQA